MTDRDERRAAAARRWAAWLADQLGRERVSGRELVELSSGQLDAAKVSHWVRGDMRASPGDALLVAQLLKANLTDALRAAGHEAMADLMADVRDAGVPEDDPIAVAILAAGVDPRVRRDLLDERAADLKRLGEARRAADGRLRALIEERLREP